MTQLPRCVMTQSFRSECESYLLLRLGFQIGLPTKAASHGGSTAIGQEKRERKEKKESDKEQQEKKETKKDCDTTLSSFQSREPIGRPQKHQLGSIDAQERSEKKKKARRM